MCISHSVWRPAQRDGLKFKGHECCGGHLVDDAVECVRGEPAVLQGQMRDVGQDHQVFQPRVNDLVVVPEEGGRQDMLVPLV